MPFSSQKTSLENGKFYGLQNISLDNILKTIVYNIYVRTNRIPHKTCVHPNITVSKKQQNTCKNDKVPQTAIIQYMLLK